MASAVTAGVLVAAILIASWYVLSDAASPWLVSLIGVAWCGGATLLRADPTVRMVQAAATAIAVLAWSELVDCPIRCAAPGDSAWTTAVVAWTGVVVYAAAAVTGCLRPRWLPAITAVLAGGSLWFVGLSFALDRPCPACFAAHGAIIATHSGVAIGHAVGFAGAALASWALWHLAPAPRPPESSPLFAATAIADEDRVERPREETAAPPETTPTIPEPVTPTVVDDDDPLTGDGAATEAPEIDGADDPQPAPVTPPPAAEGPPVDDAPPPPPPPPADDPAETSDPPPPAAVEDDPPDPPPPTDPPTAEPDDAAPATPAVGTEPPASDPGPDAPDPEAAPQAPPALHLVLDPDCRHCARLVAVVRADAADLVKAGRLAIEPHFVYESELAQAKVTAVIAAGLARPDSELEAYAILADLPEGRRSAVGILEALDEVVPRDELLATIRGQRPAIDRTLVAAAQLAEDRGIDGLPAWWVATAAEPSPAIEDHVPDGDGLRDHLAPFLED